MIYNKYCGILDFEWRKICIMSLKLSEKIKELRLKNGKTQEAVASELGVTAQAVSRWEKGICYPDMEILPSIANYFGISIDELFGYDNERAKRLEKLIDRINDMNRRNDGVDINIDECITFAREALIEFPGNAELSLALASVLYNAGYVRYGEIHILDENGFSVYDVKKHQTYKEWQEAIKIYEKFIPTLPEGKVRHKAVIELAQLYKNCGEKDKALALAESAPDIAASKQFLRLQACDGKEEVVARGELLLETVLKATEQMVVIVLNDGTIEPIEAAKELQHVEDIFSLLCDEYYGKNYAFLSCVQMLRSYYLWLAEEKDEAFKALDKALTFALKYDDLHSIKGNNYTSPVLKHVSIYAEKVSVNSLFHKELPDLWPWWDVPQKELVKDEMKADPRLKKWIDKIRE